MTYEEKSKMKKELQKIIKGLRDNSEYPKAMMTEKQMEKGTATINCDSLNKETVTRILQANSLQKFIEKYNISVSIEELKMANVKGSKAIRLSYK